MDEPLSSLDAKLRADLRVEIKRIQQDLGATILFVTHDQTEAMTLANRVGVIERGRLVQIGSPRDIYENPVNTYVATRLGSPRHQSVASPAVPRRPGTAAGGNDRSAHRACAHPQSDAHEDAMGTVTWVEHLGDQDHLHIRLGDHDFVTLSDPDSGLVTGRSCRDRFHRPAVLRLRRRKGVDMRESNRCRIAAPLIDAVADASDRPCRRTDRARSGDRRRRSRPQHEARLRGGPRGCRQDRRETAAGGPGGDRHAACDESRRRVRPTIRHAVHDAGQGDRIRAGCRRACRCVRRRRWRR